MDTINNHLSEYHNVLDQLAVTQHENKTLKLEKARYRAEHCYCRDRLRDALASHKVRVEMYESTKARNAELEKDIIELKLTLA
mmetsp:Transcript_55570/g.66812  ORF Transcript_55570/g.66812 Transcript_55570/m.66812 type:complete len:83 (+) Transcript_55570:441-689(+)